MPVTAVQHTDAAYQYYIALLLDIVAASGMNLIVGKNYASYLGRKSRQP